MPTQSHSPLESTLTSAQWDRKHRLQSILHKGLPPFRQTALELTKVLGGASPDLKKATKLIRTDPALSSQVLRACNSPLLGLRSRVVSIEHASAVLGPERLRGLVLTTSMADFASKVLTEPQMRTFWQHSLMAAMLSQYLAERREYLEKDQAYIVGLLHDIGQVPEWILHFEDDGEPDAVPPDWVDNTRVEHDYFGIDHCKLGGIMARFWDLVPAFIDVIENHHTPEVAQHDSILVRIVATVEYFLLAKTDAPSVPADDQPLKQLGRGLFGGIAWPSVENALEQEYTRLLPVAKSGLNGVLGSSNHGSEPDSMPDLRVNRNLKCASEAEQAQTLTRPIESRSRLTRFLSIFKRSR